MLRVVLALLASSAFWSCAPVARFRCGNGEFNSSSLIRRVSFAQIRAEYLQEVEAATLPPEPRKGIEAWIDDQIAALRSRIQPGDEIWYYKYEKCCGWYRAGYVALRVGCSVFEINTREDM